jgi:nitroreductase
MDALQALTTRASPSALGPPAPDAATLERLFQAAVRAPDHGRLRPWRFMIIEGAAREAFGDVLAAALRRREPDVPQAALVKERAKPLRAPLIIVVAARVREHRGVPEVEQIVAAGAAAQNLLLAAHALGFGGFWRTGAAAYDDSVKRALGLSHGDAIVGFVYLGTPTPAPVTATPSDIAQYVSHWTAPVGRLDGADR